MSLPPRRSILITGAHVLALDDAHTTGRFDIYCEEGEIREVAPRITGRKVDHQIDGSGSIAMPGLVQAHVHLCQTLFRARAEESRQSPGGPMTAGGTGGPPSLVLALAGIAIPPILSFTGALARDVMETVMLLATILWFAVTPFWMNRRAGA